MGLGPGRLGISFQRGRFPDLVFLAVQFCVDLRTRLCTKLRSTYSMDFLLNGE